MSTTALLQAIVDGILTGGVYALMAAGLTLIFGVMDIINIAQGIMVVLGAYLSFELSVHVGIGLLPGLLITTPLMFGLGMAIEFCFMRRLRDQDRTQMSILVTYAVAIVIEGILTAIFGVDYQQLQASYVNSSVHLLGFYLPYIYLIGFALAVALAFACVQLHPVKTASLALARQQENLHTQLARLDAGLHLVMFNPHGMGYLLADAN